MEELKPSFFASRLVTWCSHFRKTVWSLLKKLDIFLWARSFTSKYIYTYEKLKPMSIQELLLYFSLLARIADSNSCTGETTISWWTTKQNVLHPYNGIFITEPQERRNCCCMFQPGWTLETCWVKEASHK